MFSLMLVSFFLSDFEIFLSLSLHLVQLILNHIELLPGLEQGIVLREVWVPIIIKDGILLIGDKLDGTNLLDAGSAGQDSDRSYCSSR